MYTKVSSFKNVNWLAVSFLVVAASFMVTRLPVAAHHAASLNMVSDVSIVKVQPVTHSVARTQTMSLTQTIARPALMPPAQALPILPIVPPTATFKVLPQYPANVLQTGTTGAVLLSVLVGLNGLPENIAVKTSSGIAELDQAAVTALKQWRFSPASQGGATLASWYDIPVRFEIN